MWLFMDDGQRPLVDSIVKGQTDAGTDLAYPSHLPPGLDPHLTPPEPGSGRPQFFRSRQLRWPGSVTAGQGNPPPVNKKGDRTNPVPS